MRIALCVLIIAVISTAEAQSRSAELSSAFVLPAGFISYNVRDGYRKYDGVKGTEHIGRNNMLMFGAAVGKRFAFKNSRRRLQSTLEFGWGSIDDEIYKDAVLYNNGTLDDLIIRNRLSTIGIQTDLHILFPAAGMRNYFLSVGPNVSWNIFQTIGKSGRGVELMETNRVDNAGLGFNMGAGMEHVINRKRAMSVGYNLRIWKPVARSELGLFPMGVDYREQFFTHQFQVQILLPSNDGRFR